jgi:hypothetical protein
MQRLFVRHGYHWPANKQQPDAVASLLSGCNRRCPCAWMVLSRACPSIGARTLRLRLAVGLLAMRYSQKQSRPNPPRLPQGRERIIANLEAQAIEMAMWGLHPSLRYLVAIFASCAASNRNTG